MDWSSDLSKIYNNYKNQKDYKNGVNVDKNSDGVSDAKDLNLLKSEEKSLFSKEINIEDLIELSGKKDYNNDGNVDNDEVDFFNYVKEAVYNKLAKNINKNKELTVSDMVDLEKKIRNLSDEQQENVGQELRKLQNRMVSNLTSQFFVTKETTAYKDKAAQNVLDILEAKLDLENLEVKNNPFGDSKALDLFEKLESRSTRTLAEKYTAESIEEFKETLNEEKLVEKTGQSGGSGDGSETPTPTGFSMQNGLIYYNGQAYTGDQYTGNPGIYYKDGHILTGPADNGKYYTSGHVANGTLPPTGWVVSEDETTKSQTTAKYKNGYKISEVVETRTNNSAKKLISTVTTLFNEETHKKTSSETRIFDNEENYDSELITYKADGTTVDSTQKFKYHSNGNIYNGEYTDASGKKLIYVEGTLLTGIYSIDGKYYEGGEIKSKATDNEGKIYLNGEIANGINKENNVTNYYKAGVLIATTDSSAEKYNADFVKACNLIEQCNIKNVQFEFNNSEFNPNKFTGKQFVDYDWRDVEYNFDSPKNEMEIQVTYAPDIKCINTYQVDGNQNIITLKDAKYDLKGTIVDVAEDGSKTGIDYSLHVDVADGVVVHNVFVSEALSDGITLVREYELDDDNKYVLKNQEIHTNSINNLQKGLPYDKYDITDKVAYSFNGEKTELTITDTTISGISAELIYNTQNGEYKSGKITFANPAQGGVNEIILGADDSYRIKDGKLYVAEAQKDSSGNITSYKVTVYKADGTTDGEPYNVPNRNGILGALLSKINVDIISVSDVDYNQGNTAITSLKIDGVKYNVSEENGVVTITSQNGKIEKQFKDKVVIYEEYVDESGTNIYKRDDNGNETERTTITQNNGVEITSTFKLSNKKYTELIITKKASNKKTEETVKTYDAEGRNITGIVVKTYDTTAETETVTKTETYVGSSLENWTEKTTVEGYITTVEKKDIEGHPTSKISTKVEENKTTVTTYNVETDKPSKVKITEQNKETVKVYKANGEEVEKTTVTENGVTSVYDGDSTQDSVLKSRVTVNGINRKEESEFNEGVPSKINHFENDKLVMEEILDETANLQTGEIRKYNVTKYKADGTTVDKTGVKTVKDNGTSTIKWSGSSEEEEVGSTGITITQVHKSFAQAHGFTIKDVRMENGEEVLVGTYILGDNGEKEVKYSNITLNSGKYNYTGISEISSNVTLRINVKNDRQDSAKIIFNGAEFDVNVNGAEINDNIDANIKTFTADNITGVVNVADVLTDGIIRNRELYVQDGEVNCRETLIFGNINTVFEGKNKVSDVSAPSISSISGSPLDYTFTKLNNIGTVTFKGTVVFKLHNNDTTGKEYTLTSDDDIKLIKGENLKLKVKIKNMPEEVYLLNKDGSYSLTITSGSVATKYEYDTDAKLTSIVAGGKTISVPKDSTVNTSEDGETLTISSKEGTKPVSSITYKLSDGSLASATLFEGDNAISVAEGATVKFENNQVLVTEKDAILTRVYNNDGVEIKLIIGESEIDLTDETISYEEEGNNIIVKKEDKYELQYSKADGNIKSAKLMFRNNTKTLENVKSVVVNRDYMIVSYENDIEIYNDYGDNINEQLNLDLNTYQLYKEIVTAYETLSEDSINFDSIDTTKEITVDEDEGTITLQTKDKRTIKIEYGNNNKIKSYSVSEEKTNTETGVKYVISKTYGVENNLKNFENCVYTIGEKVFTIPYECTAETSGQDIRLTYTLDDEECIITIKYKAETAAGEGNEETKYVIDKITYKKGTTEEELDVSKDSFTQRYSGDWIVR